MFSLTHERLNACVSAMVAVLALTIVTACKQGSNEKERATRQDPPAMVDPIELPPYEPEPFEVRTITRGDDLGPPFEELRFRPTLTLAKGRPLEIGRRELPGDRAVIYEVRRDGYREIGRLYATDTGEALAEFKRLWRVSTEHHVADVTDAEGHRHLLHLDTGRLVEVMPRVPTGTVAETQLVFFPPPLSWVWLFARTAEDDVYHARWEDLDQPPPSLDDTFPMWPMSLDEQKSLVLHAERGRGSECLSVSFFPDRTYQCNEGVEDFPFASGYVRFFAEDTVGRSRQDARPFHSCKNAGGSSWFAGERILRHCSEQVDGETTFIVWGDDHVAVSVVHQPFLGVMAELSSPVFVFGLSTSPRAIWFDLESFVRYETEPLWPFVDGGRGQRKMIVVSDENYSEMLMLDLKAEQLSRISARSGCYAYEWSFSNEWGVGVECLNRRRRLLHTQFVDLDRRVLVRVPSSNVWFDGSHNIVAATQGGRRVSVMRLEAHAGARLD